MILRLFRFSLLFGLTLGVAFAQPPAAPTPGAPAQPAPVPAAAPTDELVGPIKLPDADIDTVLGLLEIYTGRSILRPQQLPAATYRFVYEKKLPKSEAVRALETILTLNQVGVAPLGDHFLKVVALSQVKTEAPEMITGSTLDLPPSGRVATKLFQLEFLRVNEFIPQITPLMTPGIAQGIVPLDKANAALITDTISNLQRVETLVKQLDRPLMTGLVPKFYQLRNGSKASDVVNKLRAMFQGPLQGQLGSATSYSADDRTNQVILLADPRQHVLFDELIDKLDVVADPNTRNEVIYLKHASAKDVAPLLSQLVKGQSDAAQKAGGGVRPNVPGQPPTPQGPNPAPNTAPTVETLTGESTQFSSFVSILAEERSNSLVVSGTQDDIRLLHEIIEKIDILLAQVRIEVLIAEVSLTDDSKSGLDALTASLKNVNGATHVTSFSGSVEGLTVTGNAVNPLDLVATLSNNGTRNNVNILSSTTLVTTHNKEAEFIAGESLPIITGSQSTPIATGVTASTGFATSSQVTYKDIAIDLKVTPLIGDDGSIQLKIDQKVDDVIDQVKIDNNFQPVIGRREANSFVNVADGELVILGGLQQNKNTRARTKLGFIWEIPILSHIFGARDHKLERTELLLFIRPHVIPATNGTADARKVINELSNHDQVKQFMDDPSKAPKEKLIEKLK